MIKFRKPAIVAAMLCFSAMMAAGCTNPANTVGTKQYIEQNQKKSITTDNLKIKQYIGLKVDCEEKEKITDKAIDDAAPEYLYENDLFDKDTTSKIKSGDLVNITFVGKIDDKEFENGSTDSYDVEIGSNSLIDNFEEQLIGHKAGDKVEVKVTFPANYEEKSLAKKKAVFETTINYIKNVVSVPDKLTDSFISKYTNYKTVKDYKAYVKKALAKDVEESFETAQENAVTDALLDKTEVTKYPEDKLKDEIEFNENYYKEYAKSMGITYKEMIQQMGYDDEDTYKKELEDYAKENVKYYLMCDAIAEEEGITVSDSDYKEKATALAKEYDYKNITAMEREYTKDRIKEVLNAREVTKFVIKNTNFNYTKKSKESTGDTTINTNASDATVTTTTEDSTTSTEATEEGTSTEKYRKRYLEEYDLMRKELFTGGYKIKTTIDHNAQEKLQKAVDSNLAQFTKKQKDGEFLVQGAATVVDNTTGKVIAIVGGRSQESEEGNGRTLNRAFQSYNQPGSTIKPLVVYTPAFEKGYSPDTIVNDQKFEGGPSNSDGLYKGLIKVSQAVIESRNTVAWQILDDIGPKAGLKYVQNMDFSHIVPSDYYDAAALGGLTYGVNTVEMASGYATIKNGGIYRKASCIDSIEDSDGNEVKTGEVPSRVYKQYATKEITEIMQDVIKKGTGRGLSLERGMPSAGKTGTTNNQRSGWFCGFSPYYSIAVWVGTDNNDEVKDLWGGTYPGSIWKDSMNALCSGKPVVSFDTTLTKTDLLEKSGKTSSNGSTATTTEKKVATTATTESEGDEEDEDDVVSRLNDLIYDYEELEIQSDSDLAQVTSIEGEIEDLLAKLKTKDNQKFYRKVYEQAKGEVQTKINQYKSSLGNSSTQMPTDQTTSNTTTESTESDSSAGSGTDNSTGGSDSNEEFGWQN